jgi:hypothetical protein
MLGEDSVDVPTFTAIYDTESLISGFRSLHTVLGQDLVYSYDATFGTLRIYHLDTSSLNEVLGSYHYMLAEFIRLPIDLIIAA